jgi:hypothetical protein
MKGLVRSCSRDSTAYFGSCSGPQTATGLPKPWSRTTNQHGCVTLHSYQFHVEAGIPKTQVLLWVSGEHLRAAFDHVVLAEYHCRDDWRDHNVQDIRAGLFHPTRVASPQLTLMPLPPQDSMAVPRARPSRGDRPVSPSLQTAQQGQAAVGCRRRELEPHRWLLNGHLGEVHGAGWWE